MPPMPSPSPRTRSSIPCTELSSDTSQRHTCTAAPDSSLSHRSCSSKPWPSYDTRPDRDSSTSVRAPSSTSARAANSPRPPRPPVITKAPLVKLNAASSWAEADHMHASKRRSPKRRTRRVPSASYSTSSSTSSSHRLHSRRATLPSSARGPTAIVMSTLGYSSCAVRTDPDSADRLAASRMPASPDVHGKINRRPARGHTKPSTRSQRAKPTPSRSTAPLSMPHTTTSSYPDTLGDASACAARTQAPQSKDSTSLSSSSTQLRRSSASTPSRDSCSPTNKQRDTLTRAPGALASGNAVQPLDSAIAGGAARTNGMPDTSGETCTPCR